VVDGYDVAAVRQGFDRFVKALSKAG